jgi:hypothetical protein
MDKALRGRQGGKLVLLVGSNPLPNYLAACALRPNSLVLVCTVETEPAKNRLKQALRTALEYLDSNAITEHIVEDAVSATAVHRAIDPLLGPPQAGVSEGPPAVWLNYTGGTKVMAAHARMAFYERKIHPSLVSYLDEGGGGRQPGLRFDDGTARLLAECGSVPLNLKTILELHGITHKPRQAKDPAPTPNDAHEILCKVLQGVGLARKLYCERKRLEQFTNPSNGTNAPFRVVEHGLTLSLQEFPTDEQLRAFANRRERESWFEQWYKFIGGEWLEYWLGDQIDALKLAPAPELTVGFDAFRGERKAQNEVDIAVVRGFRSHFISCTTDSTKDLCKSKLFEVAVRSRQLGGDLARASIVCLADDKTVAALQADVDDLWGATNTTKVFGISDIRAWSECDGKQPNVHLLKEWLES